MIKWLAWSIIFLVMPGSKITHAVNRCKHKARSRDQYKPSNAGLFIYLSRCFKATKKADLNIFLFGQSWNVFSRSK